MRHIYYLEQIIEVSDYQFLKLLEGEVEGAYTMANALCNSQVSTFVEMGDGLERGTQISLDNLRTIIPQIDDENIKQMLQTLYRLTEGIYERNRSMVNMLAKLVNLPPPENKQDWRKVKRKLRKYDGYGPVWVQEEPEFFEQIHQAVRQDRTKLEEVVQQAKRYLEQLISMIPDDIRDKQAYSIVQASAEMPTHLQRLIRSQDWSSPEEQTQQTTEQSDISQQLAKEADILEELGDQRAKDLIDEAVEEAVDAQHAIRLLQGALRFGHTGIQASKAYLALAMRYEDLDNKAKAIECYTKAMEAWHPSATIFFWRGELYYQLEQWDKARNDFEQALAFSETESLISPEREQAEKYLIELDEATRKD